jgi:undecaprenyl-diphosphatase
VPLFVLATAALWLLDRPGRPARWKVAALCALTSAGLGLLVNQAIAHVWARERPFAAHPAQTVLLAPASHDPSFPSDHATAAFAIAFAVLFFGRRLGAFFLAFAAVVAVTRVFVGLHYPADVLGGVLVGLLAAALVVRVGQPTFRAMAGWGSRITDPLVAPGWRAFDRASARHRARRAA